MFRRYSSPIIVLDLVKQQEKRPRESIIGKEFRYNQILIAVPLLTMHANIKCVDIIVFVFVSC